MSIETHEMLPFRKTPVRMQDIRLRPDVTEQIARLLHSNRPERFLDEWRLTTAGLESTLDRSDIAPEFDKDRFICDLVTAHRETALYVIESLSASVWSMVAGELLLVVPAGKLRPLASPNMTRCWASSLPVPSPAGLEASREFCRSILSSKAGQGGRRCR